LRCDCGRARRDEPRPRRNRPAPARAAPARGDADGDRFDSTLERRPVSDFVFATAIYQSGDWESAQKLPSNLIDSVARYTSVPVRPSGVNVSLADGEIFGYPFVWFTGHLPVRFTDRERANLKLYVERGGMMVMDDHNHDIDGVYHNTAMEELL